MKTINFEPYEIAFLRMALNDALDSCNNPARSKIYKGLLEKVA